MSDEDKLRRAQAAQRILNDEMFKEAIAALSKRALEKFRLANPLDVEELQHARLYYDVTEDFVNVLANYVRDGVSALDRLKRRQEATKRKAKQ